MNVNSPSFAYPKGGSSGANSLGNSLSVSAAQRSGTGSIGTDSLGATAATVDLASSSASTAPASRPQGASSGAEKSAASGFRDARPTPVSKPGPIRGEAVTPIGSPQPGRRNLAASSSPLGSRSATP